jgi:hypothetical protein
MNFDIAFWLSVAGTVLTGAYMLIDTRNAPNRRARKNFKCWKRKDKTLWLN